MIEIENLSKTYKGTNALSSINLSISSGIFGLLGPNGAGKTTFMRILATLLQPSTGEIKLDSFSLTKKPEEIRSLIGYLPQHFHVFPQLTAIDVLDYVGVMKGIKNKKLRKEQIFHWLEEVNLSNKAEEKIKTYSHGMKQRLGIAQSFIGQPSVVILDEPTIGLDPEERLRFRNLLSKEGKNKSIILSTHVVTDIESSCYEIAVLKEGKLALVGTVDELKKEADNKVWEGYIPTELLDKLRDCTLLCSEQQAGSIKVRILADEKPFQGAVLGTPTLEDGYLALIGGFHD